MFAGIISFIVGLGQFFVLFFIIDSVMHHKLVKGVISAVIKVTIYALGIFLLAKIFTSVMKISLICFGAGFFIAIAVYIIRTIRTL